MRRVLTTLVFIGVFLGAMILLIPSHAKALSPVSMWGADVNIYGFLRNNLGSFTDEHDYVQDGNDLAQLRTWLRTYADIKFSDKLSAWAAVQFVHEPWYDIETGSVSQGSGKEYSEYEKIEDVLREAYIDWKPSKRHSLKIGRQIVIWGEALTDKVGDVIHPEDRRFTFAVANWEDTRIPLWMARGIHDMPSINSSFEWLVSPNIINRKEYTVNRDGQFAVPGVIPVGQRFAMHAEDRGAGSPPLSRSFVEVAPGVWAPLLGVPHLVTEYPENSLDDTRFGFRTSTFLGGWEFGVSYFHTQAYDPVTKIGMFDPPPPAGTGVPGLGTQEYILTYPDIDIIGFYTNKDLPVGLLRAEAIYIPNKPYNTFDLADADAIVKRDYVKYMVAWDINSFFYFDWHKTAPFDITIEHVGEWVPDNDNLQFIIFNTEVKNWTPHFNMRISTNWWYNKLATELIVAYGPRAKDGLLMPIVKYMPAWRDQALSFELRYIRIFGESNYEEPLGTLQQNDLVAFTTQFNF